jgi:chaperonin GroES
VSGAVDISTGGNPGQNTPAQTSQTMVEQGQKVFAAIFKRIWRSLKLEFGKLYQLNGKYLPDTIHFAGSDKAISRADFLGDPSAVIPAADPTILSDQQKFQQAQALMNVAHGNPAYDQDEVNIRFLKALKIPGIAKLYKGMANVPPPPPDVKIQLELLKQKMHMANLEWKKLQFVSSLVEQRQLNQAKITELMAQAALLMEQAGGVKSGNDIKAFEAAIGALTSVNDSITNQISAQQAQQGESDGSGTQTGGAGAANSAGQGVSGMAAQPNNGALVPMG